MDTAVETAASDLRARREPFLIGGGGAAVGLVGTSGQTSRFRRAERHHHQTDAMLDDEACWTALLARDRVADGRFVFGVLTTGVYCKPSCAARRPRRENVRFFATPGEAEAAGLRACKRCRPTAPAGDSEVARLGALCEFIQEGVASGERLDAGELARRAGWSVSHLQRRFRAVVGVTPRAYVEATRLAALKSELRAGRAVTDAIYEAGFGSSSRVYERADQRLGMTPGDYRAGGAATVIRHATLASPVGPLMVAATERGICFVELADTVETLRARLAREFPAATLEAVEEPYPAPLAAWLDALRRHLDGAAPHLDLPLDVRASAFTERVWSYLRSIPYGERRSYGEVAAAIGRPGAARAVARACAANPVALVIPCHRVLRGDGDLAGYRWGVERKRELLRREALARSA